MTGQRPGQYNVHPLQLALSSEGSISQVTLEFGDPNTSAVNSSFSLAHRVADGGFTVTVIISGLIVTLELPDFFGSAALRAVIVTAVARAEAGAT